MLRTVFSKYVFVGFFNTSLHFFLVFILHQAQGLTLLLSNLVAFNFCVVLSYLANAKFTFKKKILLNDFSKYLTITISGSIFLSIISFLLKFFDFYFWMSQLGLQAVLSIFIYVLIKKIVF